MAENIFKEAKELWDNKDGREMTEEEQEIIATAIIPLNLRSCPFPDDITIAEGLEELTKIVEEAHAGRERRCLETTKSTARRLRWAGY